MSSSTPLTDPIADNQLWAARIAAEADLPDQRLNTRLERVLLDFASRPTDSIPQATGSSAQAKAAYRFFANERIDADDLLQPLADVTAGILHGLKTVLAVQDSSSLNFSTLETTTGLGPLNDSATARGLHMHTTLAVRDDGVALGILGLSFWARTPGEKVASQRRQRPIDEKESRKWLDGIEAAENAWESVLADQRPRLIHVMDREGDIHEVLERVSDSPHFAIIRCAQNRSVDGPINKAFAAVTAAPLRATITVDVPRLAHQPEPAVPQRQATLALRALTLTIRPDPHKHPQRRPVTWTLIDVHEVHTPAGVEPLHWLLWTNLATNTLDDILEILRFYGFRWRIEDFHLTLKSGCRVEKLELETADRLIKAATLYAAVAVRVLALRDLARVTPDAPCTLILTQDEWQVLWLRFAKQKLTAATPPPNLKQAARWIGQLGGHLGRKRDGMPGVRTLWRGFRDLSFLAAGFQAGRSL